MDATQKELNDYIEQLNAKNKTFLISDPDYWNSKEVYTPEQFDRYMLVAHIQELQKGIYGYCKSSVLLQDLTTARMQETLTALKSSLEQSRTQKY